jgi:hypothetical protein
VESVEHPSRQLQQMSHTDTNNGHTDTNNGHTDTNDGSAPADAAATAEGYSVATVAAPSPPPPPPPTGYIGLTEVKQN